MENDDDDDDNDLQTSMFCTELNLDNIQSGVFLDTPKFHLHDDTICPNWILTVTPQFQKPILRSGSYMNP